MHKHSSLKYTLLLAILCIGGFGYVFAQGNTAVQGELKTVATFLHLVISIMSWGRILFANIAGTFLTNARVYGEGIGLDIWLWKLRNIIRNISNFSLGFIFLFYLFKTLIGQEEAPNVIKNIVVKILVAGVAIQSSRFIIAATLDLSTILVSAVGAFPSQLTANNAQIRSVLENGKGVLLEGLKNDQKNANGITYYSKQLKMNLFPESNGTPTPSAQGNNIVHIDYKDTTAEFNNEEFIDMLMPNANSLVGPLIFLGISILDVSLPPTTVNQTEDIGIILWKVIVDGLGILLYAIAMVLFCMIAFIRLLYLWVFIIASPLLLLMFCLENVGKEKISRLENIIKELKENGFTMQQFFGLAFKPVIITLGISMTLVISILMKSIIETNRDVSIEVAPGTILESRKERSENQTNEKKYTTSFKTATTEITYKNTKKTFSDFLLSIITFLLIGLVIKISISSKTGITQLDKITETSVNSLQKLATNLPIIPIGKGLSIDSLTNTDTGLPGILNQASRKTLANIQDKNQKSIDERLGISSKDFNQNDLLKLQKASNENVVKSQYNSFIETTNTLQAEGKQVGLGVPAWQGYFISWLNNININAQGLDKTSAIYKFKQARNSNTETDNNKKLAGVLSTTTNKNLYRKIFTKQETVPVGVDIWKAKTFANPS